LNRLVSDPDTLAPYVDIWWTAVADFAALADDLSEIEWAAPTDLPGWSVHDVVAHAAHLEHVSVGGAHDDVAGIEVGTPAYVHSGMSVFTEQGVVARRDVPGAELVAALRRDTEQRHEQLLSSVPDGSEPADGIFGMIGWTWATLLRNRPLDIWMHEQDIRRAIGRPGNLDSAAAQHSIDYLAASLPYVLGKRVAAPPGTTAVLAVEGGAPVAAEIDADGRGRRLTEPPAEPTVHLAVRRDSFIAGAGGRRPIDLGEVEIAGDRELAAQVIEKIATTP